MFFEDYEEIIVKNNLKINFFEIMVKTSQKKIVNIFAITI
jgi:hypothetical protein